MHKTHTASPSFASDTDMLSSSSTVSPEDEAAGVGVLLSGVEMHASSALITRPACSKNFLLSDSDRLVHALTTVVPVASLYAPATAPPIPPTTAPKGPPTVAPNNSPENCGNQFN